MLERIERYIRRNETEQQRRERIVKKVVRNICPRSIQKGIPKEPPATFLLKNLVGDFRKKAVEELPVTTQRDMFEEVLLEAKAFWNKISEDQNVSQRHRVYAANVGREIEIQLINLGTPTPSQ